MKIKAILDYDCINYKEPVLTIMFPYCDLKCDKLNKLPVCQNSSLLAAPNIEVSFETIWRYYEQNPLTKGFCFQGMEPLDSDMELYGLIDFIRSGMNCNDPIVIYTGYNKEEKEDFYKMMKNYGNIIIKWGRYLLGDKPHYDEVLGVYLASDNQYAEKLNETNTNW